MSAQVWFKYAHLEILRKPNRVHWQMSMSYTLLNKKFSEEALAKNCSVQKNTFQSKTHSYFLGPYL